MRGLRGGLALLMAAADAGPCTAIELAAKATSLPPYTQIRTTTPLNPVEVEQFVAFAVGEGWLVRHTSEVGLPRYSIGGKGAEFLLNFSQLGTVDQPASRA
jgi:hypothetical protein